MEYTLQVTFTGLGVAVLRKLKDGTIAGVDLLLLDMTAKADPTEHHLPRLTFSIDDLLRTDQEIFEVEKHYSSPHFASAGAQQIELNLEGEDCALAVTGGAGAPDPSALTTVEALEWIPDIDADLGISDLIFPASNLTAPYVTRVRLPPGSLDSRKLFLDPDGSLSGFFFGKDPRVRALAEQVVWTSGGVIAAELTGLTKLKPIAFDPQMQQYRRGPLVVRLAVTNLPAGALPQRFGPPRHFPMYQMVSKGGTKPNDVKPKRPKLITPSGACPPVRATYTS
jgi:hypothetical protein